MMVPYSGRITRDLFMRAQRIHFGARWLLLFLFPILIGFFLFDHDSFDKIPLSGKFAGIGIAFLWPVLMYGFISWQWSRTFKKSPYLNQNLSGAVTDEGLQVESASGKANVSWNLFIKMRRRDNMVLLYQSPAMFHMLCREFFDSEGAWTEVLELVRTHVRH